MVLVSDAVSVAGLPPGHYRTLGMEVELQAEGVVRLSGTPYLAGSALTLLRAVTNAQEMGKSLCRGGGYGFLSSPEVAG